MAYGLDLSKFEEVDEFGNPIVKPRFSRPVNAIPTENNPFVNRGRSATEIDNKGTILPTTTPVRRGLDFDFTTKMPELPTTPTTQLTPTTTTPTSAIPSTPEFVQGIVTPNKKPSFTDWWSKMEPDRKQALTRGLLATGLNMMALGGRTYDRPVSALGIAGEAGKAGLAQYEDTYDREQAHRLRKEYLDVAKEGLKLKSDIYKGKVLGGMSASQDREYKRHLDSQKDVVQMIVPADASFWGGFFAADSEKQGEMLASNPAKAEKLREALAKPENAAYRDRYMISKKYTDSVLYGRDIEQGTRATGLNLSPETKTLDENTALEFLKQAGGDKDKARELAKQSGYNF